MPRALTYTAGNWQYHDSLGRQDFGLYERVWEGVATAPANPTLDGDGWREKTAEELQADAVAAEQSRLQAVAVRLAVPLASFAATWQATGIETVPDSWSHALDLLAGQPPEVHIKLLALRFGPLAADWDDVLTILNSPQ